VKEENAIVLDFLARGYAASYTGEPVAQAVGTDHFTLLELVPRPEIFLSLRQKVYIGTGERKEVQFIKGRLDYNKLTQNAKNELPQVIETLIKENEAKYAAFFNKAGPISIRKHSLELLPGIGRKHADAILEEREHGDFASLDDLRKRVKLMPDPMRLLIDRIVLELQGTEKYYVFTLPPKREDEFRRY
jgi:putative nucleotide binding protein